MTNLENRCPYVRNLCSPPEDKRLREKYCETHKFGICWRYRDIKKKLETYFKEIGR